MQYIQAARDPDEGCILCTLQARDPSEALILKATPLAFVLMNLYPYNPGHLMVVPKRHASDLGSLSLEEMADTGRLLQEATDALDKVMAPDGMNLGMNLGRAAGAGVPDHLHWHVVPRWNGDANFMPIVGQTRVLPELVRQTYDKLLPAFAD